MILKRLETMNSIVSVSSLLLILSTTTWISADAETQVWWSNQNETQALLDNGLVGMLPAETAVTKRSKQPFSCPIDCLCQSSVSVDCRGTDISNITNLLLQESVTKLSLQNTHLQHVPRGLFSELPNLEIIRLDSNEITSLEPSAFDGLISLRHLRLDVNRLSSIPHETLSKLPTLEILNLSYNKIKSISNEAFSNLTSLVALVLDHNDIEFIDSEAFKGLPSLKILELRHNHIKEMPSYLQQLPFLTEIYLNNNNISHIKSAVFQHMQRLTTLELRGNPLNMVDWDAFSFIPRLQKLILSEVKEMRQFPSLNGTVALEFIRIDRAKIRSLPNELCEFTPHLRSLDMKSNFIEKLPDFSRCRSLRLLDVSHNKITSLPEYSFQHQGHLHDLLLSNNKIKEVPKHAFNGLRKLKTLDLSSNEIEIVHPDTFLPLIEVIDVNLGHNHFPVFPSVGLENALHIKVHNNPNLREFPLPPAFPRVKTLALSYAYHCCPFQQPPSISIFNGAGDESSLRDSIIFPSSEHDIDLTAWAKGETMWVDSNPLWSNISQQWANMASVPNNLNFTESDIEKLLSLSSHSKSSVLLASGRINYNRKNNVMCIPEPSPFMPCQDLFDWWSLRCGVWIVFLMALLGNGAVVFVLIFARSKIDVPRFLVCNLGMADFFMGIYLGFLAVVDASTLGEFRMYAIPWQLSAGCQVAGFFGVLSSELSVFTLAVITMERNYAITHAMHLNKRLSLRHASYIMAAGWIFALIMAFLPLVGVSDYRKFAVCLPFEVGNSVSKGYVVFLMVINGVAFLILMGCYLKMYCAIRGSQAWNSNDSRIAKRMALLVFTDFLCWAPIAFFSLTAASGLQFVSLEEAKIFTVFILPLNSCCNPFLYAILTKQFKKDCVMICKAIEESRVTRGIGRCRHSSNFSNRQTPGNTNSLGDRNSSKDGSSCQCQGRGLLKEDKTSSSSSSHHHHHHRHRHSPGNFLRWLRSPIHSFLRRIRAADHELGESSSSANEYAYHIAEIQQKQQHRNKHRRAESVSSDNYSSSRSDSVKAIGCGLPLRMTGRRRNSWTVTRKPSSDSNLSSSRNDSSTSAMTASTSAGTSNWRNSRSSVSSDGGSSNKGSIRDRERFSMIPASKIKGNKSTVAMTHFPPTEGPRRSASVRDKSSRVLPTSPLAAGILRQQSVATPTGSFVQRTIITNAMPLTAAADLNAYSVESATSSAAMATRPFAKNESIAAKSKPRLTRQTAVQEESSPGIRAPFNSNLVQANLEDRPTFCHTHGVPKLEGVWKSSIQEDDEDFNRRIIFDEGKSRNEPGAATPNLQECPQMTSGCSNRLGLSFVPRKLSTIPSRSFSVNPDVETVTENPENLEQSVPLRDKSAYTCPKLNWSISKSDQELYSRQRFDNDRHDVKGSMPLLFNVANVPSTECHRAITGASSFRMIDDDVFQMDSNYSFLSCESQVLSHKSHHSMTEKDPLL